jgi:hypothetical protein
VPVRLARAGQHLLAVADFARRNLTLLSSAERQAQSGMSMTGRVSDAPAVRPAGARDTPSFQGYRAAASRSSLRRMAVDRIRSAYEALGSGEVEPLVSLIHPEMEWRGRRRLTRFWRRPS